MNTYMHCSTLTILIYIHHDMTSLHRHLQWTSTPHLFPNTHHPLTHRLTHPSHHHTHPSHHHSQPLHHHTPLSFTHTHPSLHHNHSPITTPTLPSPQPPHSPQVSAHKCLVRQFLKDPLKWLVHRVILVGKGNSASP